MSISRSAAAVALLSGLTLFAAPAHAQFSTTSAWITPFVGGYFGGSLQSTNSNADRINVGSSFTFGARLGYKFNPAIGLVFEYAHATPTVTLQGGDSNGVRLNDINTNVYEGTFNFYFGNTPELQGYLAIGGGASNINGTNAVGVKGSNTQFSTVFGLGVQKFFNDKVGATLDGRYRWVNVNGSGSIYCNPWGCWSYNTTWYGSGEVTLGLTYKFH